MGSPEKYQESTASPSTDEEKEGEYGCVCIKSKYLQCMNNVKAYVFWLCVFNFWEGFIVNGVINVVLVALERRYSLSSTESGLIASANDFGAFIFLLLVGYFGEKRHKPRLMAMGILMMATGSFLFTLPHLVGGQYQFKQGGGANDSDLCVADRDTSGCGQSSENPDSHLYPIFLIAQVILGVGAAPLFTIGLTYIDENTETKMTSLYTGMTTCSAAVGVAVGYVVGGQTLNLFVDVDAGVDGTPLDPDDPRWVGAWWIGSTITCVTLALVALPIVGFPKRLPGYNELLKSRKSEAHKGEEDIAASRPDFGKTIRDFPKACLVLLKNPTFLFTCLGGVGDALVVGGTASFGAKVLQKFFNLDISTAGWIMGAITVPGSGGGMILGGYLVKRFKLRCRAILRLCAMFTALSLLFAPAWLAHCPAVNLAGVEAPYTPQQDIDNNTLLSAPCNSNCSCSTGSIDLICSDSGLVYFSPCYAGCTSFKSSDGVYTDCQCFDQYQSPAVTAMEGGCSENCVWLYVFCALFFLIMLCTFATISPNISAVFRCVPYSQRSLAIGFELLFVRLLGTTPGPILFGYVIDSACVVWEDNCGSKGSCWIYNTADMGVRILIWWIALKTLGITFYLIAQSVYKPPPPDATEDTHSNFNTGKDNTAFIPDNAVSGENKDGSNIEEVSKHKLSSYGQLVSERRNSGKESIASTNQKQDLIPGGTDNERKIESNGVHNPLQSETREMTRF